MDINAKCGGLASAVAPPTTATRHTHQATVATDAFPFSTRSSSRDIQFRAPSCSMEAAAEQEQKQQQKEHRFRPLHL